MFVPRIMKIIAELFPTKLEDHLLVRARDSDSLNFYIYAWLVRHFDKEPFC